MSDKNLANDYVVKATTAGRSIQERIDYIKKHESDAMPATLKIRELWGAEIEKPEAKSENFLFFGCYTLPRMILSIRRYLRLLDRLGMTYTFLDSEYCCGASVMRLAAGEERDKAREASIEFIKANVDRVRKLGGKNMAYICVWCAHMAKAYSPDHDINQLYWLDLVLDRIAQQPLKIEPKVIGYFEGCGKLSRDMAPGGGLNLQGYRQLLDKVEGLKVVDLDHRLCCTKVAPKIIEQAQSQNLDTIISPCNACYIRLRDTGKGKIRAQFYLDFLCDVLQIPKE